MRGSILQVSVSRGGIPKLPLESGFISLTGIEGDKCAHPQFHGGPLQRILLITSESLDELKTLGYPVLSGTMGENLTTQGIDRMLLRKGQKFRAGEALLELTKLRVPCRTLDSCGPGIQANLFDARCKKGDTTSPLWARGGFYARVLEPGRVRAGDIIALED